MTTATNIAVLEHLDDALDSYRSAFNVISIDLFDTARFEAENGDCFDVHFAKDAHADTSPPNWLISDVGVPNSTSIQEIYESLEPIHEIKGNTQNKKSIGLDVEHMVGSFSKCLVVIATVPQRSPTQSKFAFVTASRSVEDSSTFDRAGLQKSSAYFHVGRYRQEYSDRIEYLRELGTDEEILINLDSRSGFWQLMDTIPDAQRAEVVLLENGNLRVFWRSENNDYFGLEVLDDDSVRALVRHRTADDEAVTLRAGPGSMSEIVREIEAHGFESSINS